MKNFEFYNPVKVIFGKDNYSKLPELLSPYNKIMLAFGKGSIKQNGIYDKIKSNLGNKAYVEFWGIEPNPTYETLIKAVEIIKNENVDFILAAGGGSVIDGVKFICAAVKYKDGGAWDIMAKSIKIKDALKFGTIFTLPATGSEMNSNLVITHNGIGEKLAYSSPLLFPTFSILDPEAMYSLPDRQISNGVIDAFVHITEQYITYPVNAAVQDAWAFSLLKVLIDIGPKVLKDRTNYDENANLMWAATMALNGLLSAGVPTDWSTHYIGHELTAMYGLDHAVTLAIVLPGVLRVMKDYKKDKLLHFAQNVWNLNPEYPDEAIDKAIILTEEFFNSLGVKTKLSDYGIGEYGIDQICIRLDRKNYTRLGENKNISPDIVKQILLTVI
ncbi:MAG TPA: iron-containing alcohol dehydrogenase [Bacteroidales bacterium]|nr:iron-containing alcohol dehydrogenase [Bacteroidales bacterium]HOM36637.1 iron-containing alcohol dehydrogenase [Bacteroidales bacterium]HPD24070.1 iron-containing alcohol dehydrogenase [Bacteroidales bacterium]HRT00065.1 iron-containing alcohol dehydrogenase [Bacteroidales bacterium]HRT80553.1 iron-containing alcohol dehydrogenase [Bacteroidales bacterium]